MSVAVANAVTRSSTVTNAIIAPGVLCVAQLGVAMISGYVSYSKTPAPPSAVVLTEEQQRVTVGSKFDNPPIAQPDAPGMNLRVETEADEGGHLYQETLRVSLESLAPPQGSNPDLVYHDLGPLRTIAKIQDVPALIANLIAESYGLPGAKKVAPLVLFPGVMSTKHAAKQLIESAGSDIVSIPLEGEVSETLAAAIKLAVDPWTMAEIVGLAKYRHHKVGKYAFQIEHVAGTQSAYMLSFLVKNTTMFIIGIAKDPNGVLRVCRWLRDRDLVNAGPTKDRIRSELYDIERPFGSYDYESGSISIEARIEPPNPTAWHMTPIPRKVDNTEHRVPRGNTARFDHIGMDDALEAFNALDKSVPIQDGELSGNDNGPDRGPIADFAERMLGLGANPISMMGKAAFTPMIEIEQQMRQEEMLYHQGRREAVNLMEEWFLDPKNRRHTPRDKIEKDLKEIEARRAREGVQTSVRRVERAVDFVQAVQNDIMIRRNAKAKAARNTGSIGEDLLGPDPTDGAAPETVVSPRPPATATNIPAPASTRRSTTANRNIQTTIDDGEPPAYIPLGHKPSPYANQNRPARPAASNEPTTDEVMADINRAPAEDLHVTETVGFRQQGVSDIGRPGFFVRQGESEAAPRPVDKGEQKASSLATVTTASPPTAPPPAAQPKTADKGKGKAKTVDKGKGKASAVDKGKSKAGPSSTDKKQKRGYATVAGPSEELPPAAPLTAEALATRQPVPDLPANWNETSECARLCEEIDHCREGDEYEHVIDDGSWFAMSQEGRDWLTMEPRWREEHDWPNNDPNEE